METTILQGLHRVILGLYWGLYWNIGKENGNYHGIWGLYWDIVCSVALLARVPENRLQRIMRTWRVLCIFTGPENILNLEDIPVSGAKEVHPRHQNPSCAILLRDK